MFHLQLAIAVCKLCWDVLAQVVCVSLLQLAIVADVFGIQPQVFEDMHMTFLIQRYPIHSIATTRLRKTNLTCKYIR